jgi:hypothetical protein
MTIPQRTFSPFETYAPISKYRSSLTGQWKFLHSLISPKTTLKFPRELAAETYTGAERDFLETFPLS